MHFQTDLEKRRAVINPWFAPSRRNFSRLFPSLPFRKLANCLHPILLFVSLWRGNCNELYQNSPLSCADLDQNCPFSRSHRYQAIHWFLPPFIQTIISLFWMCRFKIITNHFYKSNRAQAFNCLISNN